MESWEALKNCIGRDSELIAKAVGKDATTVRKWKEDPIDGSGSTNPLDLVIKMVVCSLRNGRTVADVSSVVRCLEEVIAPFKTQTPLQETAADVMTHHARLLSEYAAAIRDGRINPDEARRLRREIQHSHVALNDMVAAVDAAVEA